MREFTKAMGSYFLASSMFGLKQFENMLTPRDPGERKGPATQAFDAVTAATLEQLGSPLQTFFRAVDISQRFLVGLGMDFLLPVVINNLKDVEKETPRRSAVPDTLPEPDQSFEEALEKAVEREDEWLSGELVFQTPDGLKERLG